MPDEVVKIKVKTDTGNKTLLWDLERGHGIDIGNQFFFPKSIDLKPLAKHPKLFKFDLDIVIWKLNLKPLAKCPNLHTVLILSRIVDLKQLKRTSSIENVGLRGVSKLRLAGLSSLRKLYIGGALRYSRRWWREQFTPFAGGIGNIGVRENRFYSVKDTDLIDELDLQPLSESPHLEHLVIIGTELEELNLDPLRKSHNLQVLCLEGNRFTDLDLSPLSDCKNLEVLYLDKNYLSSIDLSPLASCHNLKEIVLKQFTSKQSVNSIDITPLKELPLEILNLGYITETPIDLSPLSSCKTLKHLEFNAYTTSSSLNPLAGCINLETLRIESRSSSHLNLDALSQCNKLRYVDIRTKGLLDITPVLTASDLPFSHCRFIADPIIIDYAFRHIKISCSPSQEKWQHRPYSELVQLRGVDYVVKRLVDILNKHQLSGFRVKLGILEGLEMTELSGFDGDLRSILTSAPRTTYHEFREHVYQQVVAGLEEQFEHHGPTLFLDVDVLSTTPAAVLIPSLLKRRNEELNQTKLFVENRRSYQLVDLSPIWLTGDGFRILKQMKAEDCIPIFGDGVGAKQLDKIVKSFKEIDTEIEVVPSLGKRQVPMSISNDMRNYVMKLVEDSSLKSQILRMYNHVFDERKKNEIVEYFLEAGYDREVIEHTIYELLNHAFIEEFILYNSTELYDMGYRDDD